MLARLLFEITRVTYVLRGAAIPLFVPSLELADRKELGTLYCMIPHGAASFLDQPITVAFHTGDRTLVTRREMVMLTRPVPFRHLRWLRTLIPQLQHAMSTIISALQAEEPDFRDIALMQKQLANPTIAFSSEQAYGEWYFCVEQPDCCYRFIVEFDQVSPRDSYIDF